MSTHDRQPAGAGPAGLGAEAVPVVDAWAVLAGMQDQLDDLTATVVAQQATIDELLRRQQAGGTVGPDEPPRSTGRR